MREGLFIPTNDIEGSGVMKPSGQLPRLQMLD